MLIPFNVTQSVADLLVSSSSNILVGRVEHCDTIGHCRTVWNIIWSCLITIFACIWVAVHPNIPKPKTPSKRAHCKEKPPPVWSWAWASYHARTLRGSLSDLFRRQMPVILSNLREKLAVALLALLAPEFIFVWALRQWLRASALAEECCKVAATESARDWRRLRRAESTSATVIAKERTKLKELHDLGFSRRDAMQERDYQLLERTQATRKESGDQSAIEEGDDETAWTTTHGFFILMGGFHQFRGDEPLDYLLPTDVVDLVSLGLLIPPSEEEINDRSKSDSFSKLIVLMQTLWFVMQSIARHIEHLPITELEIATLAYSIPILGIYICWWNKPLGVTQPIRISKSVWDHAPSENAPSTSLWDSFVDSLTGFESLRNRPRIPRFSAGRPSNVQIDQADIVTSIITILFGAVHCFAWSFQFPSEIERQLWRVASIITTVAPIVWTIVYTLSLEDDLEDGHPHRIGMSTIDCVSGTVVPIYLIARLILLTVACLSLRLLPRAAYETVYWTTFIPHV